MKMRYYLICKFLFVTFIINAQVRQKEFFISDTGYLSKSVAFEKSLYETEQEQELQNIFTEKLNFLLATKHLNEAVKFVNINLQQLNSDSLNNNVIEKIILVNYLSSNYDNAISYVEKYQNYNDTINKNWLHILKILSLNEKSKWDEGKNSLKALLVKNNADTTIANDIYSTTPKLKNLKTAKLLSTILPGTGLLYLGKWNEAFLSAGLILGFSYLAYHYYFVERQIGAFLFCGASMAGSFYFGGQRRTEILTRQINEKKIHEYNTNLTKNILDIYKQLGIIKKQP